MPKALKAHAGFSFFELTVVIAVLALMWYLSLQIYVYDCSVRAELELLCATFIFMQRKAILEHEPCRLIFDDKRACYKAAECHALKPGVCFGFLPGVLGPPSLPTVPLTDSITWPEKVVTFYPNGTISAGAVYLTDHKKSVLYALTTDASAVTHIRRYRFKKRWILLGSPEKS
jgi:hypothetical protein